MLKIARKYQSNNECKNPWGSYLRKMLSRLSIILTHSWVSHSVIQVSFDHSCIKFSTFWSSECSIWYIRHHQCGRMGVSLFDDHINMLLLFFCINFYVINFFKELTTAVNHLSIICQSSVVISLLMSWWCF